MSGDGRAAESASRRSRSPRVPQRLRDVDRRERNIALMWATGRCVLSCIAVFAVYFSLPLNDAAPGTNYTVAVIVVGGGLFIGIGGWQIRSIMHARFPQLRAVESLAIIFPLFFVSYAIAYALMADRPGMFNEPLTHTGALYFVIVTFGTVGYGDITPTSDGAQLVVASQILLDLVLLGVVFKLVFGVSKMSLERGERSGNGLADAAEEAPFFAPEEKPDADDGEAR